MTSVQPIYLTQPETRFRMDRDPVTSDAVIRALKADRDTTAITLSCNGRRPRYKSVFHVQVDADHEGHVTLTGQVPSPEMSRYIEKRVRLLDGVAEVHNQLDVVLSNSRCEAEQKAPRIIPGNFSGAPCKTDARALTHRSGP